MKQEMKKVYLALENIRVLENRITIANSINNKKEVIKFKKEKENYYKLLNDVKQNCSPLGANILNDYYVCGWGLKYIAKLYNVSYETILKTKKKACVYILENNLLEKYIYNEK